MEDEKLLYQKRISGYDWFFFVCYLLLFVILSGLVLWKQPFFDISPGFLSPPDEATRYNTMPYYIYLNGHLPIGDELEVQLPIYGGSYAYMPGLTYILMSVMMRIFAVFGAGEHGLLLAARLVNLLIGLSMMVFIWLLGRRLYKERLSHWIFCVFCGLLPEVLFVCSYVNMDALSLLAVVIMFYAEYCMLQDGVGLRNIITFTIGTVFCALSYYNVYGYLLMSVPYFITLFIRKKDGKSVLDYKNMLKWGFLIIGLFLLGAGWWFIRSAILHDGDFLGLATLSKAEEFARSLNGAVLPETPYQKGEPVWALLRKEPRFWMFCSFIACYGSLSIYAVKWYYLCYALIIGGGLVGLAARYASRTFSGKKEECFRVLPFYLQAIGAGLITYGLWYYYAYVVDYQLQGRYVLSCVFLLGMLVVKGYEFLGSFVKEGVRRVLGTLLLVTLILLPCYFVFGIAIPAYAG